MRSLKGHLAIVLIIVLLMIAFFTYGCTHSVSNNANPGTKTDSQVVSPKYIDMVYYYKPVGDINGQSDPVQSDKVRKIIADATGVNLEVIIGSKNDADHTNKLNILLYSGQKLDIFQDPWVPLYQHGFIADITEPMKKYAQEAMDMYGDDAIKALSTPDGRIWAFPIMTDGSVYPVWLRGDWLKKYNIPAPATFNDLEEVLKLFRDKDPAGNGNTMVLVTSGLGLRKALLGAFTQNGDGHWIDKNGRVKPYFLDPGYRDFLEKMHEWYQEGLIQKETFSYNRSNIVEFIKKGQVAGFAEWYSMITLSYYEFQNANPGGSYVYLDGLTSEKGYCESVWPLMKPSVGEKGTDGVCVSVNCEDKDAAVKLLNWGYKKPENFITAFQGIEGENWKWVDESTNTYDIIQNPEHPYIGEFNMYMGLPLEQRVFPNDPTREFHNVYVRNGWLRFDKVKWPADKYVLYDDQKLKANIPNYVEIDKLVQEEMVRFITGARPLSEFDTYMEQLDGLDIDKMVDEFTRQYREMKKQ